MPDEICDAAECGLMENPAETRERQVAEKVMVVLRSEKLTHYEAHWVIDRVKRAIDKEATLGYSPVSEV